MFLWRSSAPIFHFNFLRYKFFVSGFRKGGKTLIEDGDEVNDCAYRNAPI